MINTVIIPKAYSEVYSFINALGEDYKEKIPSNVYNIIRDNRDKNYNPEIKNNQTIDKKMLSHEAISLIAALNLQYWCEDNDYKKSLKAKYINNTKNETEKYSYENIFKNNQNVIKEEVIEVEKDNQLIEYTEPKWYQKIFSKILNLLKNK